LYAGRVVVVNCDRAVNKFIDEVEVFEDIDDLLECFLHSSTAPISASAELRVFGAPVDWAAEPYDVAGNGAGFEEVVKDGRIVWVGH